MSQRELRRASRRGALWESARDYGHLGHTLRDQGRLEEAEANLRQALKLKPEFEDAHNYLGVVLWDQGRLEESEASYRRALQLAPDHLAAHNNLGNVLRDQGRLEESEAIFRRVLHLKSDYASAHNNLGNVLRSQGRLEDSAASYRRAVQLKPDYAKAHSNLGKVLRGQGRLEESAASHRRAVQLKPDYASAHSNLGATLADLGQPEKAIASYRRALKINPDFARAHFNLGATLADLGQPEKAIASYRRALKIDPDFPMGHFNLALLLSELGQREEAIASYRRSLEIDPDYAKAHYNLGLLLSALGRREEAIASYRCALDVKPSHPPAFTELASQRQKICDWSDFAETSREVTAHVRKAQSIVSPFMFLAFSEEPGDQLRCARQYIEHKKIGSPLDPVNQKTVRTRDRIRLGYLSADFHNHATAILMAELFELHDRKRFEVFAFSFGPDRNDSMRRRLQQAFEHFHDVRNMSDAEAAAQIRDLGVDIAIDLSGYTKNSRPGILALRPAPIQVNYLVYPGTMGAKFIDYIIVDRFIVPVDQQQNYAEKLVHLPDCYQVNDTKRAVGESPPSRASCGLPESGFVFCCFCANYKITPAVFDVWMRLLKSTPGSTLWLLRGDETAERNLRREAQSRGVEPERLVFAPRLSVQKHLARQRHADLFLDTLPYNAHTTASEALWAGLPILTCVGRAFPGRVCGSILHAAGLPELVTNSLEDYEALAFRLASDPVFLGTIRTKLARNRETAPLFDTNRFRLNIEAAYTQMWRSWESGQPPKAFAVQSQERE